MQPVVVCSNLLDASPQCRLSAGKTSKPRMTQRFPDLSTIFGSGSRMSAGRLTDAQGKEVRTLLRADSAHPLSGSCRSCHKSAASQGSSCKESRGRESIPMLVFLCLLLSILTGSVVSDGQPDSWILPETSSPRPGMRAVSAL